MPQGLACDDKPRRNKKDEDKKKKVIGDYKDHVAKPQWLEQCGTGLQTGNKAIEFNAKSRNTLEDTWEANVRKGSSEEYMIVENRLSGSLYAYLTCCKKFRTD